MENLLPQLNSVPGILGSMVCSREGQVVGFSFPRIFDLEMMKEAASILADSSVGLETITGSIGLIDLRYSDSRIIIKPTQKAFLLLMCSKNVNLQLLVISCSVAAHKIEKLLTDYSLESMTSSADLKEKDRSNNKTEFQWWPSL